MKKSLLVLMAFILCINVYSQVDKNNLLWIKLGSHFTVRQLESKGFVDGQTNYKSPKTYEMDLDGTILTVVRKNFNVENHNKFDIHNTNEVHYKLVIKAINDNNNNYVVYKKVLEIYDSSIEQSEKFKKAMQKKYGIIFKKKEVHDGYYSLGCIKNNIKYLIGVRKDSKNNNYIIRLKAIDLKVEKEIKDKEQDEIETEAFIDEQNFGNY